MQWSDTRGETVEATRAMIDMICGGVAAFFGPEGSCYVEAIVAQSRNIPMISYVSKPQVFNLFQESALRLIHDRVLHCFLLKKIYGEEKGPRNYIGRKSVESLNDVINDEDEIVETSYRYRFRAELGV